MPPRTTRSPHCPEWCVLTHGVRPGEDDLLHIGGALIVQRTVLRLCTTIDVDGATQEGPLVLLGALELTLHEAEAMIAALTQLVDQGRGSLLAQEAQGGLAVLDP